MAPSADVAALGGAGPEALEEEVGDRLEQRGVIRLLHSLEDEGWIGGGILGLEGAQLLETARVGHHGGELFECVELVHA